MKKSITLLFVHLLLIYQPLFSQSKMNIYEIGKGEILSKPYVNITYLYDDLLSAVPFTDGVENYDWSNLTGVIDFNENVIVPFKYRNIRLLKDYYISDEQSTRKIVAVSTGTLPTLYQLTKTKFKQLAPFEGVNFYNIPINDDIVFTAENFLFTNHIFNLNTKEHIAVKFELDFALNKNLLTFYSKRKKGIMNLKGQVVVPADYYGIYRLSDSFIEIKKGERGDSIGVLDKNANVVIPPIFSTVTKGYNRFFVRAFNHKTPLKLSDEVIKRVSNWSLKWNNSKEKMYSLNKKQIQQLGLVGAFDFKGNLVIPFDYDYLEKGIGSEIIASKNEQIGIITENGKEVMGFKYKKISAAFNNLYIANLNGKYGLFSSKGKQLLSCIYDDIFAISSNKALVLKQGKWFLFDSKTSKMTNTKFTGADKLGYINRVSIPFPFFRDKKPYADTYFLLIRNGKYGVIDHQLNVLIPPTHDEEPIFYVDKHFTFGNIYSDEETFLYTRKGVPMKGMKAIFYTHDSSRLPNTIICKKGEKYGVIDMDGKELIPFVYSFIQNIDEKRFIVTY